MTDLLYKTVTLLTPLKSADEKTTFPSGTKATIVDTLGTDYILEIDIPDPTLVGEVRVEVIIARRSEFKV